MAETTTIANVAEKQQATAKSSKPKVLQPKADAAAKLQPLGEDETATRETRYLQPKVVEDTFTFRLNAKDGRRFRKTVTFDFTDCSQEDLINLALQSARIDLQSKLRAMGERALDISALSRVNVKLDIVEKSRDPLDVNVAAARRLVAALGCSHDEAIAIIEREKAKREHKA